MKRTWIVAGLVVGAGLAAWWWYRKQQAAKAAGAKAA